MFRELVVVADGVEERVQVGQRFGREQLLDDAVERGRVVGDGSNDDVLRVAERALRVDGEL